MYAWFAHSNEDFDRFFTSNLEGNCPEIVGIEPTSNSLNEGWWLNLPNRIAAARLSYVLHGITGFVELLTLSQVAGAERLPTW